MTINIATGLGSFSFLNPTSFKLIEFIDVIFAISSKVNICNSVIAVAKIPPLVLPSANFEVAYCIFAGDEASKFEKYLSSSLLPNSSSFEPSSESILATVYKVLLAFSLSFSI